MNSLPIVWEKIKLREIIKLNYGKSLPEKNRKDGQISVYGSNGIIGKHNEALVHYSTIVIGRKGSVGKASLSLLPCWVIDTAFYTEIINPNINLKYLYLFCLLLESNVIFPKGVKPGINREEYLNNEIILPFKNNQPDLDGQKYIVNKIDKSFTEAKKGEYLTKITLSNVIKILHSELKNTFTTSNGLREIPLGDICQTTSGGTPNRSNREYYGGRIPWLKSGELNDNQNIGSSEEFITENGLQKSNAKILNPGTLLVAMYGATVGKLGILRIKATTNQAICAIVKNNNISNKYLYWFLYFYRDTLIKRTFGGAQPNISQKVIRQIPILLPFKGDVPDLDAQNEIVHKIEAIYDEIKKANVEYQKQINLYSLLRKSILNYAFKGKL